jgi:asparagine synthase (glutamine-hydrolysing)
MCGIVGTWPSADKETVEKMMGLLIHRGPDAAGIYVEPNGKSCLGHRRLSIMDPGGGNQPIFNESKTMAIVANGEIYNFLELRKDLIKRHEFVTTSDTEAIIHCYEEFGTSVVNRLDGMFAFVISDNGNLFAARDPLGIKPLYYAENDGTLWFGSELKALAPYCSNIREFPPGSWYHTQMGFRKFYEVPLIQIEESPVDDYIKALRNTLENSVEKRLMSDVPLGAFLSGGLDSSIIAAIAKKHMPELHTFTVGVEGSPDLESARVVARHLGTIHHEHILAPREVADKLPEIIYCLESFDQDLVRSGIPCYFTSRLAAEHVKVILTGEGADELFAGYTYYKDITEERVLNDELRRSVECLHNINLQRVDRMTMVQSIEGRVPFLDVEMIELGLKIPSRFKLDPQNRVEKWILRKAFEDLLPNEIVWREKEQFDEGSGTVDLVGETIDILSRGAKSHSMDTDANGVHLRSREERLYYEIFMDVFDSPESILSNVGRWAVRPDNVSSGLGAHKP